MLYVFLINLQICYDSTDVSDSEQLLEFSKKCFTGCILEFASDNYVYFKDKQTFHIETGI